MNVLITGANGFIGRALCSRLASDNKVVGVDITAPPDGALNIAWEQADPPASPVRLTPLGWRAGLSPPGNRLRRSRWRTGESDGGQA